jgi:hypothetical protein
MALIDSQGRLFGKVSILDAGSLLVILLVILGIFTGTSNPVAQTQANLKTVEVEVIVKGWSVRDPEALIKAGEKVNLIIRNQPYGEVDLKSVKFLPKVVLAPQPDGGMKPIPDPLAEERLSTNMLLVLSGRAQEKQQGFVFGNSNVKVGNVLELDGRLFNFNATVIDIQVKS